MKKFYKILWVFLAVLLWGCTLNIGAFAGAVTPPPSGRTELTKDNLIVAEFKCQGFDVYPKPVLKYRAFNEDGGFVDKDLDPLTDYTLRYTSFPNLSDTVVFEITGRNGFFTEGGRPIIKSVNLTNPPIDAGKNFQVSLDRENEDTAKGTEARTYTYLENIHFTVTLPEARGSLKFFVGDKLLNTSPVDVNANSMAFSYDTSIGYVQAGENSKHFAVRVVWSVDGKEYTKFSVGITLNRFDLSKAKFEPIKSREVISGVPYEPKVYLLGTAQPLSNGPNCKISYFNNVLESNKEYPTKVVVEGFNNFIGTAEIPFELYLDENTTTGIVCDRSDKTYTYGDKVVFTAYVRSGTSTNNKAKFVCNDVVIGTAPVSYVGNNGTAVLEYDTGGEEFFPYDENGTKATNTVSVEFESNAADVATVDGIRLLPKPLEMIVHCKDKTYDGTDAAVIPVGPNVKNYTFVGRVKATDNLVVTDADIGYAVFSGKFSQEDSDWYAGDSKATKATGFKVTGKHAKFYKFPEYAYGTAKISKKYDATLKVTNPLSPDRSTYVYSGDKSTFGIGHITLDNAIHDKHIGDLSFKVTTVMDIDRGGIFEGKPVAVDKTIDYKVKDLEIEQPAQTASLTLVVSSVNYTDVTTDLHFTIIEKKWAKIGGFSISGKTYDGKPVAMTGKAAITSQDGGLLISSKELVFNYQSADGGSYSSPTAPFMPGKYYLVITLPKTAYGYYGKTVLPFSIDKAAISVWVPSFEIYQGQESLPEIPITFSGFVNNETAGIFTSNTLKATHSVADAIVPGKYPIVFTGEVTSDRYYFNYGTGTLSIIKVAKYPAVDPLPEKVTGLSVYLPKKSLPDKIDSFEELALSVNAVSAADDRLLMQVLQNKIGFKNYKKMDITLVELLTGKAVQPKSKVTISMPYPAGSDSTMVFRVLHLYKKGTKIEVITPTKVVGGLQWQVSEFSPFVIGWSAAIKTEDTDFFIKNSQITTEKKQFTVAVREDARKSSYALTKFFEASTHEKSVVFKNPDVIITFEKDGLALKDNSPSYDFYAVKNSCEHELAARALGGDGVLAVVHFNHEGYWPGTAQVSVNMGKELRGTELAYYHYNQDQESLDYVTKAKVDGDGWFTVPQDHCSDYVISTTFPAITPPSPTPSPTPAPTPEPEEKVSFMTKALNFVKGIPGFLMNLPKNAKNAFTNISQWAGKTFGGLASFFSKITKPIANVFKNVGKTLSGFFGGAKDKVGDVVGGVKGTIGNVVASIKENIVLLVGLIIVLALIVLIVLLVSKILKKKREEEEDYSDLSDTDTDDDMDNDADAFDPNNIPKNDDDIEY